MLAAACRILWVLLQYDQSSCIEAGRWAFLEKASAALLRGVGQDSLSMTRYQLHD